MPRDASRALQRLKKWLEHEDHRHQATILRRILLSLAGYGQADLIQLRELDREQLGWLNEVLKGIHTLSDEALLDAAGSLRAEEKSGL